jgi:ATP-dependent RNA helicase DeaD
VESSGERPSAPPKKRLTDRELFELLQAGKPLPPMDDPTESHDEASHRDHHDDRGRRERRPRETPPEVAAGQARVWLNLGKMENLDESSIVSTLEGLGAPAGKVLKAEVKGTYSYVHVAEGDVAGFEALDGKPFNQKSLKIERARR